MDADETSFADIRERVVSFSITVTDLSISMTGRHESMKEPGNESERFRRAERHTRDLAHVTVNRDMTQQISLVGAASVMFQGNTVNDIVSLTVYEQSSKLRS